MINDNNTVTNVESENINSIDDNSKKKKSKKNRKVNNKILLYTLVNNKG